MCQQKQKKKVAIYSLLMSGCLNISASLATLLLDKHSDEIEIWFITGECSMNTVHQLRVLVFTRFNSVAKGCS